MSSKPIRWGIIGPGRIAELLVPDFVHVPNAKVVAVASRTKQRAEDFATRHAIAKSYGSYEAIIADPDVDVLYVATPNRQHRKIAIEAVRGGKALLVEKSFATTVAGAREMIDAARANGRFVMEAMWTRFQPIIVKMRELIASGAIGEVRAVQADLGVDRPYNPNDRLFDPHQGGGAMLDLGVYLVSFAQMVLGTPRAVVAQGSLWPTGVDAESGLLLDHGEGRRSVLFMTLRNATPGQARVFGSKGFIDVLPRFHHPTKMVLHRTGAAPEPISLPPLGGGYAHELIEVTECLLAGRTESAIMPLADTLAVQTIMNDALEQLGVVPTEEP
ncbi:putative oxidoreductase [Labilithrix luteola]|uniref:Putative oxidoreductase n=1 Tax=Labilithrix luteola TaxID=1391654 RepID=A0A0K1PJP7_9BACT|nr:Gfo/Idh/MocA family oxidoreductase [Labilithrix luteola]AKU93740.1 putative oxidoreductase [Labilithrix luteola]